MAGEEDVALDFFFSSRRRHTRLQGDWSSDVCSSDLAECLGNQPGALAQLGLGCQAPGHEVAMRLRRAQPAHVGVEEQPVIAHRERDGHIGVQISPADRKSTRLNSSHLVISYAVFCLKKKTTSIPSDILLTYTYHRQD